jgi:hypothetical protein
MIKINQDHKIKEDLDFIFDPKNFTREEFLWQYRKGIFIDISNFYYVIIDCLYHENDINNIVISKYFTNRENSIGCTIKGLVSEFPFYWASWEATRYDGTIFSVNQEKVKEILLDINKIISLKEFL